MTHTIIQGDCLQVMSTMEANSIEFIVTDPPYGLHFMGKNWDHGVPGIPYWQEALRICKPGAMLATFGGTRTHHRLMTALEDAGWEIRDCIFWCFGQGFPKSHNFGKQMEDEAWKGYGTALKPAHEPIILCQKPYEISRLFVMILMDITNEVFECQKLNYNVNDAEMNLSDTLLLLDKVHQCIVQEPAKTCAWEKLSDVNYVMQNATFLKQELQEKINLAKELFVLENVKESGRQEDIKVKKILAGEEECIFAGIQGIATFVTKEPIEQNIVLLWKIILQGIFQGMNKFTIRTVINLITELKILKLCLHPNISNDIGSLNPKFEPIILAMKPLDGTFKENAEKWGVAGINIDRCRIPSLTGQRLSDNISRKGLSEWEQEKYLCISCVNLAENKTKHEILELLESFVIKNVEQITIENVKKYLIDTNIWDIGCLDILFQEEQNKKLNIDSFLNMLKFGKELTVKNLWDMLFIISTMTRGTTELKTCCLCCEEIMEDITERNILAKKNKTQNTQKEPEKNVQNSRWPANLILSEEAAQELDRQSGFSKGGNRGIQKKTIRGHGVGENIVTGMTNAPNDYSDSGGASRFFYCAKASSAERNRGLEGMPLKECQTGCAGNMPIDDDGNSRDRFKKICQNHHPTVKPIALMKYIIKLLAPPNNPLLLDPFCGSGSTIVAAKELGIRAIGIELESEYVEIARKRIENTHPIPEQLDLNLGEL